MHLVLSMSLQLYDKILHRLTREAISIFYKDLLKKSELNAMYFTTQR